MAKVFPTFLLGQKAIVVNRKKTLFGFWLIVLIFSYLFWLIWFEFRVSPFSIKDFLVADFDNDGRKELALVVWKKGSFGSSRPFWLKSNTDEFSMHLFLYQFKNGRFVPKWHSSGLENPVCRLKVRDKSGKNELEVQEGMYIKNDYSCTKTKTTYWQWNGWGFTKID